MQKMIVGMMAALILAVTTVQANAAAATRRVTVKAVQKTKSLVGGAAKYIWRNKEGIAIGATTTAVLLRPEVFLSGAASVVSSPWIFYLIAVGLLIVGGRYLLRCLGLWRVLPLLMLALLLSCGVAEASEVGIVPMAAGPGAFPWRLFIDVVIIIIMLLPFGV